MRLEAVLLSLLLSEASAAPRKKRDIGAEELEHPRHAVSFFDSFFSFFGGGLDSSPISSTQVGCSFNKVKKVVISDEVHSSGARSTP